MQASQTVLPFAQEEHSCLSRFLSVPELITTPESGVVVDACTDWDLAEQMHFLHALIWTQYDS